MYYGTKRREVDSIYHTYGIDKMHTGTESLLYAEKRRCVRKICQSPFS